jgi:hypothetical protein
MLLVVSHQLYDFVSQLLDLPEAGTNHLDQWRFVPTSPDPSQ